jgi:hypothetical protein
VIFQLCERIGAGILEHNRNTVSAKRSKLRNAMIDTLAYVRHLEAANIDQKVAEAHIEAIMENVIPDLATKADVLDLKVWISELKVWIVATALTVAAFAVTIAKLL